MSPATRRRLGAACLPAVLATAALGAQAPSPPDSTALRPITLEASPVDLTGPARAGSYVSAVGRRALAMGTERGGFEVWAWPVKLLHGLELRFRTPLSDQPIDGWSLARTVTVTPAGPVISYTHPAFTVRQTVFAAREEPAVVMVLDVDAVRPLEVLVEFVSDLQLAWPAAVGGQYVFWEQDERSFVLSESRRRLNAMVGSPFTVGATSQPAHDVPDAPSQLRIAVGGSAGIPMPRPGEPVGRLTPLHVRGIPVVIVGGVASRDSVRAIYRRVLERVPQLYRERQAAARTVLQSGFRIESPDPTLDLALGWAGLNLDEATACNPDLGCSLVAGYGPSEPRGTRPGFGWFFGGDAAINTLGLLAAGQDDAARQALEFFGRYQRADGKIPHEISQSAGQLRWFEDFPYAFYHADTTPYWLLAWGEWWRWTGDTAAVRRAWPAIRKAFDWCRGTVDSTTGLMLNSRGGLGAIEVGDLGVGVRSDIYLSAIWVEALDRVARMADAIEGRSGGRRGTQGGSTAALARRLHATALASLRDRFWLPDRGMYAFALLEGGEVRPELTAWPATAMSFGLFDEARGMAGAGQLAGAALQTDWGTRSLAASSALFDPLHYNNGAVWPFVTGFAALAQYRYRNPVAGFQALQALAATAGDVGLGRNPEVYAGMQREPLETAVPQQFFGTSFVLTAFVRGLLGWEPDLPAATLRLAPALPPAWDSLVVRNAPAGRARFDIALRKTARSLAATIRRTAGPARSDTLVFEPHLPIGAVVRHAAVERGTSLGCGEPARSARDVTVTCRAVAGPEVAFAVEFDPGFEVILPPVTTARGGRSSGLRLVDQRMVGDTLALVLEGPAGTEADIQVRGGSPGRVPVSFPTEGDPVDGYARASVRVGRAP